METEKIELNVFLLAVIGIVIAELAARAVISEKSFYVVQIGVRLIDIGLIFFIVQMFSGGMESIGLGRKTLLQGTIRGLFWSAGFAVITAVGFLVLYGFGQNPFVLFKAKLPINLGEASLYFIIGAIIAPVAEECFFRGIVYGYFRRWGVAMALISSTALFAVLHSVSGIPLTQIIGGIVFAIAYEIEGQLMVPIVIHILGNSAIFSLAWYSMRM